MCIGSFAASLQALIGNVAAGSLFAALQSFGVVFSALIPALGGLVLVGTVVTLEPVRRQIERAVDWVRSMLGLD